MSILLDKKSLAKVFSPRIIERVITTFDSSMTTVVATLWLAAFALLALAMYTVNLSVKAKLESETAAVGEPSLPQVVTQPLSQAQASTLVSRLQRQFPEISFTQPTGNTIAIGTNDGSKFRLWLTVLSYIDTISPEYRWALQDFCVGMKCPTSNVMYAIVKGDNITFSAPVPKEKD